MRLYKSKHKFYLKQGIKYISFLLVVFTLLGTSGYIPSPKSQPFQTEVQIQSKISKSYRVCVYIAVVKQFYIGYYKRYNLTKVLLIFNQLNRILFKHYKAVYQFDIHDVVHHFCKLRHDLKPTEGIYLSNRF